MKTPLTISSILLFGIYANAQENYKLDENGSSNISGG